MVALLTPMEEELRIATKCVPKDGEGRQRYLIRLLRAVNDLPKQKWDKLRPDTRVWCNLGLKAVNAEIPVRDIPGARLPGLANKLPQDSDLARREFDLKKPLHAKERLMGLLMTNPKMRNAALKQMLDDEGYEVTLATVQSWRADVRHVLRFLVKNGLLPPMDL